MEYTKLSSEAFVSALASKAPVPGGGGTSALVGALGVALGHMVGSLTVGKKRYAAVEGEMLELMERAENLQAELLRLVDRDAEVFEPLSRAYGMPKETPKERAEKERVMEEALDQACLVPLEIMGTCCEALRILREFAWKGSAIALSDAGVGAAFCKAALQGASLNVMINTRSMKNRERAAELADRCDSMLTRYTCLADEVFDYVQQKLKD